MLVVIACGYLKPMHLVYKQLQARVAKHPHLPPLPVTAQADNLLQFPSAPTKPTKRLIPKRI